jgi:outer membrane protein
MKRALLFALVVACCATSASAQLKVGYIDSEVLKERLPEILDVQRTLEQLQQDYEREIMDRRTKLKKIEDDFQRQELLMSEARKAEMRVEFEAKVQQLQQFTQEKFGPEGELTRKQIELLEPIFKKINDAIRDMAEEGKYDFIFDSPSAGLLLFAKPEYDLTEQLIERMEKEKEEGEQ